MAHDTNQEAYQTKDNVVVTRGESKRPARIIGSQSDEQGEAVLSYFVRYFDDAEPMTEWVPPSDVMPEFGPNKSDEAAAKPKKSKK